MNLEMILEMWKEDSVINEHLLDQSSIDSAKLHSKYLELISNAKLRLKKAELDYEKLLKNKWLYYNGKLSKQEIDDFGWQYDPFNGLKVLKGDMDYYYNADTDIQNQQAKIHYIKTIIDTLKEIIDNIKWRHQTIKNIITWRQFTSGA